MLPIINPGQFLFRSRASVYSTLEFLDSGLVVDVGAANGETVCEVLRYSPTSRVVAFEPFPGNLSLLREKVGNNPNVRIVPKAVANTTVGTRRFHVPSKRNDGGSSTGLLVPATDPKSEDAIDVEVTAICAEIKERVRFLKIDVQGGEDAVLQGAEPTVKGYGVDFMQVEFLGHKTVPWRLLNLGYVLFDSKMFLVPVNGAEPDPAGWFKLSKGGLSTGSAAYSGWPMNAPRDPMAYCEFMHELRQTVGYVWTDLIAVHDSFMPTFLRAVARVREMENLS